MHRYIYTCLAFLLVLLGSADLFAQEKFEKESSIKQRDVPQRALDFIDAVNVKTKLKWYLEEGINRKSIEAKFQQNNKQYSIEFDTLGHIEDVEIEILQDEMTTAINDAINKQLKNDCSKHKIEKIQIQYSGTEQALLAKLRGIPSSEKLIIKYELVVKCTSKNKVELLEYLFNDTGNVLSTSTIVFKNSSHLEY